MAIQYRHAVGLGADDDVCFDPLAVDHAAQQQPCLLFDLFLLAANVGHNVAQDVQRSDAGVARPGDGLHGRGEYFAQAKCLVQGFERHDHARDGTVWAGDEQPRPVPLGALPFDHGDVIGIDLWDEQGDTWRLAVGRSIGTDGVAGPGKGWLKVTGHGSRQG